MLVKKLCTKDPFNDEPIVYENLEAEDSTDFEGFIKLRLLKDSDHVKVERVMLLNRNTVLLIVPETSK